MNNAPLVNSLSDSEQQILLGRLYHLLSRQTTKYLADDSTSIPVETAEELLRSIIYTLRLALSESGMPERELLTADLAGLLRQGQDILQGKLKEARQLWERACLTAPQIPNVYLQDTLNGFKVFFKRYDFRYFAHQIPCAIDYPLCVPVSTDLQGVSYVEQWLRRLLLENWLLSRFPRQAVDGLLGKIAADYWDYPLNLCEQPLINGVGLATLRRSIFSLELSDEDCQEIGTLLFGCDDIKAELDRGVASAATELRAPQEAVNYIRTVLYNVLPRIQTARQYGSVSGIFIV